MTLVSVVIPYFNRADWLKLAVESVLSQTYENLEVIVVDDGSDDRPAFLEAVRDGRVRYVRQAHRGASAARNQGLRLARGTYIAFLDADDVYLPEKLEVQVARMEAEPEIAWSHTSYWRMDAGGNNVEEIRSGAFRGEVYPEIVRRCPIATPTVMIRRDALAPLGIVFDERVKISEDTILWIEIARYHRLMGIDRSLTKVRLHGRNAYSDPVAQYLGGMTVLERAFRGDARFGPVFRRRALAGVCSVAGHLFLEQGERTQARRYFARALLYWPFDKWIFLTVIRLLLPPWARGVLRRVRNGEIGMEGLQHRERRR